MSVVAVPELETDPYLRWIEDSLTTSAPTDLRDPQTSGRSRVASPKRDMPSKHAPEGRPGRRPGLVLTKRWTRSGSPAGSVSTSTTLSTLKSRAGHRGGRT